jgi:hypothetical protein
MGYSRVGNIFKLERAASHERLARFDLRKLVVHSERVG